LRIILAVVLGLVALAALFFVVAGVVITISGIRTRRGVKGDIALTGFFLVCFVLAAGGGALVALPGITEQAEPKDQQRETPGPVQPQAASETGQPTAERTEDDTLARSEPAATPDPSLALDCKDFTSQGAAQKAFDQGLEDQDALDPDADGNACEALADPDPKPKPDPEKESEEKPDRDSKPEKESESRNKSASEKKSEPEKESESEKKSAPQKEPASEKKAEPGEKR
jgi:hypothetical protein